MSKFKVAFVGAGNMAEAIVSGMVASKYCEPAEIMMTDIRPDHLAELVSTYGVSTSTTNDVVNEAACVVLAVKPQIMGLVLEQIAPMLNPESLVVSIAAGVSCATMEAALVADTRVVRVMPNAPALVGQGAAGVAGGAQATGEDIAATETIMNCVGLAVRVEEKDLDAVTALSGSGPAYVFYLLESMLKAADKMGLDPAAARVLALKTVEGAARLMADSGEDASVLRERVTSKGGTTAAALNSMDESNVGDSVVKALIAARDRSIELSKA